MDSQKMWGEVIKICGRHDRCSRNIFKGISRNKVNISVPLLQVVLTIASESPPKLAADEYLF